MHHLMSKLTDAKLIEALRAEKSGAIEEVYRRYGDDILAYAQRRTPSVALDVQQDVFTHLIEHATRFPTSDHPSIRPWLFSVAKTTVATWKRALTGRGKAPRKRGSAAHLQNEPESYNACEIIDTCDDVDTLLAQLTPARSAALRAIYLDDLTYSEAAAKLGISEKALNDRLLRAKRQLREVA